MTGAGKRRLLVGSAVALLAALTLLVARESRRAAPPSPLPTIDNPGPQGLEAAYLYLAQRGGARPLDAPYTALPKDAKVLVAALPFARAVDADERRALLAWVDQGGTLVVLGEHARTVGELLGSAADPVFVALHLEDREVDLADIGRDVKALLDSAARPEELEVVPARPLLADPLLEGVHLLAVSAGRGFEARAGPAVPLVAAADTPVVLSLPHGQGRIVLFAGSDVLTNARIDLGDDLQLLANLGAQGPVLFDELHHREVASVAARALARHLGLPALAALLVAALLALASGRRLGAPAGSASGPARTARDYAIQLGRLYARARAEPALAADLLDGLRRRARDRVHLPPAASDAEVAARLDRDGPEHARRYRDLCERLEQASRGPLGPEGYAALARDAAHLGAEL